MGLLSSAQTTAKSPSTLSQAALLQRKCTFCGQHAPASCTRCKKKQAPPQRSAAVLTEVDEVPAIVHEVLNSSGQPLDSATRAYMESRFAQDFSQVRVHTDAKAAESARTLESSAYTVKENIIFANGQYTPKTLSGQQLLAHELTHVVQQKDGIAFAANSPIDTAYDKTLEAEADQNALEISNHSQLSVSNLNQVPRIQRIGSNLPPKTPRPDPDIEKQRLEAINIVSSKCLKILATANKYGVSSEAIAGAILWEALENPYHRSFKRLGPGKVHPTEMIGKSEAEKVEDEKRVPASKDDEERTQRLTQTDWAITYIAAIMQRHADNYKNIAGVDVTNNPGVLCTLYQGGKSEERAKKLAERRKIDPKAQPIPADEMGPWVEKNMDFIKDLCIVGDVVGPSGSTRVG